MKDKLLPLIYFILGLNVATAQDPTYEWLFTGGNPSMTEGITSVMHTANGSYYCAGIFSGNAVIGDTAISSLGAKDIFVAFFQGGGNPAWIRTFGGPDDDFVRGIHKGPDGSVYLTGSFSTSLFMGSFTLLSSGGQDLFVSRLTSGGDVIWASSIGNASTDDIGSSVSDHDQNLWITGRFYNTITVASITLESRGASDFYIACFNPAGQVIALEHGGGSSSDYANSLDIGPGNTILVTGYFFSDITLGNSTIVTSHPAGIFYARFSPGMSLDYLKEINGTSLDNRSWIKSAPDGSAYIAGGFNGDVTLGNETYSAGEFNLDIYIAKLNPQGDFIWSSHGGGNSSDDVAAVATDEMGSLYIGGHYLMDISFEDLTLPYTLCCGSQEIYIVKFEPNGEVAFGKQVSGERAALHCLDLVQPGIMYAAGVYQFELHFDTQVIQANNETNHFLTRLEWNDLTGTDDHFQQIDQSALYPNPVTDRLVLPLESISDSEIRIRDLNGNLAWSGKIGGDDHGIDLSRLAPGIYFIRFLNSDSTFRSTKFVKK